MQTGDASDRQIGHPPDGRDPYANLGVYERTAFFVNPTAGSPVGGAKEILAGAKTAGVTLAAYNIGDGGYWFDWNYYPESFWARCDTAVRCSELAYERWEMGTRIIANIESPEITHGFCSPAHAVEIIGKEEDEAGAIITEAAVPHADWTATQGMPIFIEVDPNVELVRTKGVRDLVEYGRVTSGNDCVIPALFITQNAVWDGLTSSFPAYWEWFRAQWPAPLPFALYSAELVPDWSVIK